MKTRIKEVIDSNGMSRYYIQYKLIWWFTDTYPTYYDLEQAKKHLEYKSNVREKIHE